MDGQYLRYSRLHYARLTEVENAAGPRVVLAFEVVVGNDSIDGRVAQRRLVDELQGVGDAQEWQDIHVNLAQNSFG